MEKLKLKNILKKGHVLCCGKIKLTEYEKQLINKTILKQKEVLKNKYNNYRFI